MVDTQRGVNCGRKWRRLVLVGELRARLHLLLRLPLPRKSLQRAAYYI